LSWNAVSGASGYRIYRSSSADGVFFQIGSQAVSQSLSYTDSGLTSSTTYYYKVSAVNVAGEGAQSAAVEGRTSEGEWNNEPTIIASDSLFTIQWDAVENAVNYEIYISTSAARPGTPEKTVFSTSTVISGLFNKTLYYVWVKAVLSTGSSRWSQPATAKPWPAAEVPETPSLPVIVPGANQLAVTWQKTGGTSSYQVFINTQMTIPASPAYTTSQTPPETGAVISLLEANIIYYVWVQAVNNAGASGYSTVESGSPQGTQGGGKLGLYKGAAYETAEKIGSQNLEDALAYISSNAVSGDNYYIVIGADVTMTAKNLSYSGKTVSITLMGFGMERQISLSGTGALFTVSGSSGNEVTLVLDNNISLKGVANNTSALVRVYSDGKLLMKNGSRIFGNTNSSLYGGGVCVFGGTFTKTNTGGVIYGNDASIELKNTSGTGYHAVFWYNGSTIRHRNTTVSANEALSTSSSAGWD
jgi:hypothetical protein